MLNITTLNFELKYLSERFYTDIAPNLKELLKKEKRPYCVLLVKIKTFTFALPLRSALPKQSGIGIPTVENKEKPGVFKGIDFSKAILVNDKSYLKDDIVQLKEKSELLFIQSQDKKIVREFKKYVEGYITMVKNNKMMDDKYQFSTLQNYHNELKI